jgi:hypothetical protein
MALVVEDGTGLTTANAYIDVDFATDYHGLRCNDAWGGPTVELEAAIIRATEWLDRHYDFQGARVVVGDSGSPSVLPQALAWPREGATHSDGIAVPSDAVPVEVQNATAELALVSLAVPLDPESTDGRVSRRDESIGSVRIAEDFASAGTTGAPEIPIVTSILRPLLAAGSSFGSATLNRA